MPCSWLKSEWNKEYRRLRKTPRNYLLILRLIDDDVSRINKSLISFAKAETREAAGCFSCTLKLSEPFSLVQVSQLHPIISRRLTTVILLDQFWVFQAPVRVIIAFLLFLFFFIYFSFIITTFSYWVFLFFVSPEQIWKQRAFFDRLLSIFGAIFIQTESLIDHFLFDSLLYFLAYDLHVRSTPLFPVLRLLTLYHPECCLIQVDLAGVHFWH